MSYKSKLKEVNWGESHKLAAIKISVLNFLSKCDEFLGMYLIPIIWPYTCKYGYQLTRHNPSTSDDRRSHKSA